VQKIDINKYRAIIVISGDGLIFEVINGLIKRKDWKEALKLPIAQLPGGSANGLAGSIAFLSQENIRKLSAEQFSSQMAFNLLKYKPKQMDLLSIQLSNGRFVHSFMNVEWSIVADVDTESEHYRFMGEARFVVGALVRILSAISFFFNLKIEILTKKIYDIFIFIY
jgi:sphingosine kinase